MTDPYGELEAALEPLRAAHPGITLAEASPLLPERLRKLMWERAVDRYLDDELAGIEPMETVTTILDVETS